MSDQTSLYLLERLSRRHKTEDFITEAFLWILQQKDIGNAFLDFLERKEQEQTASRIVSNIISDIRKREISWNTQKSFRISSGRKRPDMICATETQALIFEHKIWTKLHDKQLENYRKIGKKHFEEGNAIILITARNDQYQQNPNLHFLWRDVYSWLNEWLGARLSEKASGSDADNSNFEFVCRNFLNLLKKRGLGPMKPIEEKHLKALKVKPDLDEGIKIIKELMRAVKQSWFQQKQSLSTKDLKPLNPSNVQSKWGRIGFGILPDWKPGIFVGVLYDGKDHQVKLDCADACVILDMSQSIHEKYHKEPHYKNLVEEVKKKWPTDGSKKWRAIHHLETERNPNLWHPIHIRRKLSEILLDGESAEEQVNAFIEAVKGVVEFFQESEEFWNLRNDLERQHHADGD